MAAACDDSSQQASAPETPDQIEQVTAAAFDWIKGAAQWGIGNDDVNVDTRGMLAKNYYLVLDGSASMDTTSCSNGKGRMNAAKDALTTFINTIPDEANLALFIFDTHETGERVALGRGGNNRRAVLDAVNKARAGGGTPLGASISEAFRKLAIQAQRQAGYGEYNIVVITDGDSSDTIKLESVFPTPVLVQTIGFCVGEGHDLNKPGLTIYYNAMNPEELTRGLTAVLAEQEIFDITEFEESN